MMVEDELSSDGDPSQDNRYSKLAPVLSIAISKADQGRGNQQATLTTLPSGAERKARVFLRSRDTMILQNQRPLDS